MDQRLLKKRVSEWIDQYKYVLLVVAIGVFLMVLPDGRAQKETAPEVEHVLQETSISEDLEGILSQIQGVGKVKVLITEAAGPETIYQTDTDETTSADTVTSRVETVLVGGSSTQNGLVRTVTPPIYLGAIVVCQGGDLPGVKYSVVQAVAAVTGIGADHITVLKMK